MKSNSQISTTGLNILYEDATLQVVEKPAGIDVEAIQNLLPKGFFLAHRLDKDTSGVLLVAKTENSLLHLQKQFQKREVEKTYLCLVEGNLMEHEGEIATLLGRSGNDKRKQKVFLKGEPGAEGKREATTHYKMLKQYIGYTQHHFSKKSGTEAGIPGTTFNSKSGAGYTFLEVRPKTGRKHQIRVHLSSINHPIAGDKLYGFKDQKTPEGLKRQFLHAHSLTFTLPSGKHKTVISQLPEDLSAVLKNISA
ncbi:MAG: RluA family pseudouridine synthase [bacterium]|nr:RluA family pseudouridine synthase [bacterium]